MDHDLSRLNKDRAQKVLEHIADVDPKTKIDTDDLATVLCYVLDHKPTAVYVANFEKRLYGGSVNYEQFRSLIEDYAR